MGKNLFYWNNDFLNLKIFCVYIFLEFFNRNKTIYLIFTTFLKGKFIRLDLSMSWVSADIEYEFKSKYHPTGIHNQLYPISRFGSHTINSIDYGQAWYNGDWRDSSPRLPRLMLSSAIKSNDNYRYLLAVTKHRNNTKSNRGTR